MKKGIFGLLLSVFLLFAGAATAGPVEVLGGLDVLGTPGADGITFPDGTKQTTAGSGTLTSVGTSGGLTGGPITTTGTISIAPGGVADSMLATGISGSKISGNISGNAASITGGISESQVTNLATDLGNKAANGANSDITSLSGLTTPLSISQGGTGATTASGGRTNLDAAASGANSDITSLSGLTAPLSISQGGTGATNAEAARANIGACTARPKAPVLSSGQMITYAAGDDGNFKWGVAVSNRFTDNGNGTVTDNLTSLIWLKNANCFSTQNWANALVQAYGLANGGCGGGLSDGSVVGDWRLPNRNELKTLVDASQFNPALPTGNPFTNVQADSYWSSTTFSLNTAFAWIVYMSYGYESSSSKANDFYVWPVRGGQ